MIAEALSYPFFQQALLASLLASVCAGIVGSFVVVKRVTSISGGVSHAAFGGVGLGYFLGVAPMLGALAFGVLSALIISAVYLYRQASLDSLISMVWSVGMALGVIFIALSPGYVPDLNSYLFGNVLLVPWNYLISVAVVDLLVIALVTALYFQFELVCFDEEYAEVIGLERRFLMPALLVLVALVVVVLIRVVGVILTIALLTMPAAIARQWSNNLFRMMTLAVLISIIVSVSGLFLSYWLSASLRLNLPTGPLMILISTVVYAVSSLLTRSTGSIVED